MLSIEHFGLRRYHEEIHHGFYGENGYINDSLVPGARWKLKSIRVVRVVTSVAVASVEYLTLRISSILGSFHNITLYSENFSTASHVIIDYSQPLGFLSDDQLVFDLSVNSGTNLIGFQFEIWSARG